MKWKTCAQLIKEENGASAVIVGILLIVIIGFSAMVIDVGHLYEIRRQLQSAADAAAMAAAQEVINGGDEIEALNVAEDYAGKNDFPQDKGTEREVAVVYSPANMTEVTPEYVRVSVKKDADLFLAPVFSLLLSGNFSDKTIFAQAKAQVVYVTGGTGLVPWGISIVRASKLEVEVEGGGTTELSYNPGTGKWEGSAALPTAAAADGYRVSVTYYNSQQTPEFPDGFPETVSPASFIAVHSAADPVRNVYFSDNYLDPGGSTYLYVESDSQPSARVGNTNYNNFTPVSAGLYRAMVTAPNSVDNISQYPVEVEVGNGVDKVTFSEAAVLVVRRSTHPVKSVEMGATHFTESEANATFISVELNDFIYGVEYDLKVVAGPETGNFNALDYRYVTHSDGTEEGMSDSAADYYDNILYYPGEIHIGDIIVTKTGNLSGPTTIDKINERIGGCNHDLASWEAAGRPGCGRVMVLPVVEKIERLNGRSEVIVESIASFFINDFEKVGNEKINITGQFIEYMFNGSYQTTPPSGLYLKTARLTTADF